MEFRTEILLPKYDFRLGHSHPVLSIGSCFADMVGRRFEDSRFDNFSNPYGTTFNPISIFKLLTISEFDPNHFVERDGIWYSLDAHSEISDSSKEGLLKKLNEIKEQTLDFIHRTDYLVLTLGTAFVHIYNPTGEIISNCQKVPQRNFTKRLLSSNYILKYFKELDKVLRGIRPEIRYIFTVSPVRHIKETLELNQVSKATLRVACHKIVKECPSAVYFPAYEIMMDDLRDYRFYKEDLIHPSEMAETYIWQKFSNAFFTEDTLELNDRLAKIHRSLSHRPLQPNSTAYLNFLTDLKFEIAELSNLINLDKEMETLEELVAMHLSK